MAFNFYDTHTLLASVQQLPPLHSFLLDRYFPTNAASDVFATDDVLVEYRKGSKKAAPFVAPRKGGITILREGYTMKRFTPAHIAPKRPLSIDDLKKRGFGEALYTNLTPAQRQGVIMLGDLDELRDMNTRRKEAMAAEVIFTNGCIMHEYTLNQDINPDELRKRILCPDWADDLIGATRVQIIKPEYTELNSTTVAKFSGKKTVKHIVRG